MYGAQAATATGIGFVANQWNAFKLVKTPTSFQGFLLGQKVGLSVADPNTVSGIFIGGASSSAGPGSQPWWFDNVRIRKYAFIEPSGTMGPEAIVAPSESAVLTVQPGVNRQINVTESISALNLQLTINATTSTQLLVTRLPTSPIQTPLELTQLGVFFRINANQTAGLTARIRLYFTQSQAASADQTTLAPYTYNAKNGNWSMLDNVSRDLIARWVEGTVHHFSLFGVFSQLVSHTVPNAALCWYCAWWLWAGAGSIGAVGTGAFYRKTRRNTPAPKSARLQAELC